MAASLDPSNTVGIPIASLELSIRATNCLSNTRYKTIEDLEKASNDELRRIPRMGEKTIKEIRECIRYIRGGYASPCDVVVQWALAHSNLILALMHGEAEIKVVEKEGGL